jgi:hypothetical protein
MKFAGWWRRRAHCQDDDEYPSIVPFSSRGGGGGQGQGRGLCSSPAVSAMSPPRQGEDVRWPGPLVYTIIYYQSSAG